MTRTKRCEDCPQLIEPRSVRCKRCHMRKLMQQNRPQMRRNRIANFNNRRRAEAMLARLGL